MVGSLDARLRRSIGSRLDGESIELGARTDPDGLNTLRVIPVPLRKGEEHLLRARYAFNRADVLNALTFEIYAELRKRHPDQVEGVWIRRVHSDPKRAKFAGQADLGDLLKP